MENHLNVGAHPRNGVRVPLNSEVHAFDLYRAFGGRQKPHQHTANRGLARPAFANEGIGGALFDLKVHFRDGGQERFATALQDAVEPGFGDIEDPRQPFDGDICVHAVASAWIGNQQAARPPDMSGAGAMRHLSWAYSQRR